MICISCHEPKATLTCGLCEKPVCKKCAVTLAKDAFYFVRPKPFEAKHYCGGCFDERVAGPLSEYEGTFRRAKQVLVFLKSKSEETRLMSRSEKPIKVEDCSDEPEVFLRLAYIVAEKGLNAIIDVATKAQKVRNAGYQTTRWSGTGIPSTF